ncbi:MAG TPA: DUF692 domain-containing protein [Polyangiaceae bacterium]|nr:DUF692 domain-containing protein [Polyangiaceae bacterium]
MEKRFDFPNLGIGLGLRTVHYGHLLEHWPEVGWFEILSENYMQTAGRPLYFLDQIAERYPVVMHGVSMSIGGADPLDRDYLTELKALKQRTHARWVSDHLCWTGVAGKNTHDLLPMPYTDEALRHTAARVREVQDFLESALLLENPSSYLEFANSSMKEWEFLAALAEEADCGLLLDVNNIFVSAHNHGFSVADYLAALPFHRVVQMHVAGHTDVGTHFVDTHIGPVIEPVWRLARDAYERAGGASLMLEWDAEIPSFDEVHTEAKKAETFMADGARCAL